MILGSGSFCVEIALFSLCLCEFFSGTPASSHSPKTCEKWDMLMDNLNCLQVWMVACLYMSPLPNDGEIGSSPDNIGRAIYWSGSTLQSAQLHLKHKDRSNEPTQVHIPGSVLVRY